MPQQDLLIWVVVTQNKHAMVREIIELLDKFEEKKPANIIQ